MILIADSGSTKTDWCLMRDSDTTLVIQTQGINPYHQAQEAIGLVLAEELLPQLKGYVKEQPLKVIFYGAGCANDSEWRMPYIKCWDIPISPYIATCWELPGRSVDTRRA